MRLALHKMSRLFIPDIALGTLDLAIETALAMPIWDSAKGTSTFGMINIVT